MTSEFDLMVLSPQVLDLAIGTISTEVARRKQPRSWRVAEGVGEEPLRGQLAAISVAAGETVPSDANLAGDADRHRLTVLVENVDPRVRDRPSDRHALARNLPPAVVVRDVR